jgi:hypothetical protein
MVNTPPRAEPDLPTQLALGFAPLHKRAFGIAVGTAAALLMLAINAVALVRGGEVARNLTLLKEYFYGYTVSWTGAVIATAWAFFVGFVAGWFVAFSRNLTMAVSLFVVRTKADLAATRDFLDHI